MDEELEEMIEIAAAEVPETPEQREQRLKQEDYDRRNRQQIAEREDILRRNGVIGENETLDMDTEAALRQRCCF